MGKSKAPKPDPKISSPPTSSPQSAKPEEPPDVTTTPAAKTTPPPPTEDFESYYIKRVTAEFADDIDRLRNAPDFTEQSVPVLIRALKQGSRGFSEEERERVMKGW